MTDPLRGTLRDLAAALAENDIRLIVAGGYGLVLRHEALAREKRPYRYGLRLDARSTGDIDCILSAEIITDARKTRIFRETLEAAGFVSVEQHWAFAKPVEWNGAMHDVRIELMAPDIHEGPAALLVQRGSALRIRPKEYAELHARRNPAAVIASESLAEHVLAVGGPSVYLPHAASFILMKLFAFRDRRESDAPADREIAPYHAFDCLTVVARMNRAEWEDASRLLSRAEAQRVVAEAREIIAKYFGSTTAEGLVELAAYARSRLGVVVGEDVRQAFALDVQELFSAH